MTLRYLRETLTGSVLRRLWHWCSWLVLKTAPTGSDGSRPETKPTETTLSSCSQSANPMYDPTGKPLWTLRSQLSQSPDRLWPRGRPARSAAGGHDTSHIKSCSGRLKDGKTPSAWSQCPKGDSKDDASLSRTTCLYGCELTSRFRKAESSTPTDPSFRPLQEGPISLDPIPHHFTSPTSSPTKTTKKASGRRSRPSSRKGPSSSSSARRTGQRTSSLPSSTGTKSVGKVSWVEAPYPASVPLKNKVGG